MNDPKDTIAQSLRPAADDALRGLFAAEGARAPILVWSPGPEDYRTPMIFGFAHAMGELLDADGQVRQADFRPQAFSAYQDWLMLLDVENAGDTFRYRHYGDGIAAVRGISMVGRTTDGFGGHISTFFNSVYRAVLAERCWLLTIHEAPKQVFARSWERLIVPLIGTSGEVAQFAVLNVPDNELRAGLEIIPDPVIVADENRIVRFANRAAREMFDRTRYLGEELDLYQFAGLELSIRQTPTELACTGAVHDQRSLAMRNTLIQHFRLTICGTLLWGHAFYVITLRPDLD